MLKGTNSNIMLRPASADGPNIKTNQVVASAIWKGALHTYKGKLLKKIPHLPSAKTALDRLSFDYQLPANLLSHR